MTEENDKGRYFALREPVSTLPEIIKSAVETKFILIVGWTLEFTNEKQNQKWSKGHMCMDITCNEK